MREEHGKGPRQPLREDEAKVSPCAHVTHHRKPAQALDEQILERMVIRNGFNGVRQELDLIPLLSDVAPHQKIVCRLILDGLVSAERLEGGSRGNNRLAKSELDAVKLARHENTGKKIADHADGLEMLCKGLIFGGNVQRGHAANLWIAKGRDDGA